MAELPLTPFEVGGRICCPRPMNSAVSALGHGRAAWGFLFRGGAFDHPFASAEPWVLLPCDVFDVTVDVEDVDESVEVEDAEFVR